jgi:acetoin utilization protein AcuB
MSFKGSIDRVANVMGFKRSYTHVPPMCIADVMTRSLVSVSPEQTFGEVVGLMTNRPFRHVLVIDSDGRLGGVISDRDVLRKMASTTEWQTNDWKTISVQTIMTRDVLTVKPETTLSAAGREMTRRRINCLPVLDESEKVCGIVTSTDLLRAFEKLQGSLERLAG